MKKFIKISLIIALLIQGIGIQGQPVPPSDSTIVQKKLLKKEKRKAVRKKIINTVGLMIISVGAIPIFIAVVSAFGIKQ